MSKTLSQKLSPLFTLALVALVIQQSGLWARATGEILGASDAAQVLKGGQKQIVDVREKDETTDGMLKGAAWAPLSGLEIAGSETLKTLAKLDPKLPVYVYCRSGKRADRFASYLNNKGFKAINVGGFEELKAQGLETIRPQ